MPATLILQFTASQERVEVSSFSDASKTMRNHIATHGYGASSMRGKCGTVLQNNKTIGVISYNGRAWTGPFPSEEIVGDDLTEQFE